MQVLKNVGYLGFRVGLRVAGTGDSILEVAPRMTHPTFRLAIFRATKYPQPSVVESDMQRCEVLKHALLVLNLNTCDDGTHFIEAFQLVHGRVWKAEH